MREIKFRAWLIEYKKYVYISGFAYGNTDIRIWWQESSDHIYNQSFNPIHIIIEQYTGLKDSEGKEIYEDDIISLGEGDKKIKLIISFKDGAWVATGMYGDYGNHSLYDLVNFEETIKVIGNKHEN